jgi:hypothetical protein
VADTGDQLLREINEDLKRDQWLKLWRAYGRYVAAVAAVLVVFVLAFVGWREYRQSQLGADGHAYWLADRLDILGDRSGAAAGFGKLAEEGHAGYVLLARLREGQALADTGDAAGAVAAFDAVASDSSIDADYRLLGHLYAAMVLIDGDDAEAVSRRLEPVARPGSPWRASAMELQGILALKTGDRDAAAAIFDQLAADPATPTTLRNRAAEFAALARKGS